MKRIVLSVIFCVCCQTSAYSQALYSLQDLCRAADKNAEIIKIADQDLFIADQEKNRALSVLIPRATLYGNHLNYINNDALSPDANIMGAKLTQSFTLNGRELIAYGVTKKGIEKAGFSKEAIRADYLFQVAQYYFQTLSAKRLVEIAQAEVQRLEAYRNSVQEKLIVGNVTKTALYRAEAELSRSLTDKIVAENRVGQNMAGIVRLAGIEDDFQVSAEDVKNIEGVSFTLDEITIQALANRYEIKEAEKNLEIAAQTVKYEKGDYWPSLSIEGGYRESDFSSTSQARGADTDKKDSYIQAELVFTLYDGGLRKAQVLQAKANEKKARQGVSLEEKQVIFQSKVAYLEFETARNALINLQDELKSAQENYKAVDMQFTYGMADSIDMMDANTLLVQAEQRISDAEYTYYLSILKVLYTKGELLPYLLKPA